MNDHSKDSQTRYLREAAIVLAKEGFQLDEVHTDRLCILLDGAPLCEVTENGGIAYRNKDIDEPERIAAKDKVYEIVRTTAEYMRQMEMAPFLKADGLEDGYKVLADFNGTFFISERSSLMPYYFMRDTPLQALEQLMMSQPGQKPRGGGIYRSPFRYTPEDVACEYCQNYDRKHPCRLCECTCLEERIEAGVLELNEFVRECFAPSMGPQFRKRMHQQFRERKPQFFQFFLSDAHRRRWTHWRERCWRLSDRNKASLYLLTAYESLWRRMVWKCGNDGFDFQSVRLGGIEPELYSVYQAAKAIAVGCCNITLADLASPELVTDEAFHLITGALLMAKYGDAVLNLKKGVDET